MALPKAPDVRLEDVKWRVDSEPSNDRARFIPYIDAFIASSLLDEWVTPSRWRDEYEAVQLLGEPAMLCHLSVYDDELGVWVTKTDLGVPSHTEKQKGLMSDAFKRAASLKWGVARNVYRLPNLWAPVTVKTNRNGKTQAFPNDKTLPAILAELRKRGFSDAAGTVHDEDEPGESEPAPANPSPTTAPKVTNYANHQAVQNIYANLTDAQKKTVQEWWKERDWPFMPSGNPNPLKLSDEQAEQALDFLDTLEDGSGEGDDASVASAPQGQPLAPEASRAGAASSTTGAATSPAGDVSDPALPIEEARTKARAATRGA